jgi:molybdopterin-guanine dinucleotide biosynthesis protein A
MLPATGVILAGGDSRRMGRDKASLETGGVSLLARTAETLQGLCPELIIAGGDRWRHPPADVSAACVPDPPGTAGPLAGLAAGLAAASHPTIILVSCDMPFLSGPLLAGLHGLLDGHDAVVPDCGQPQPLHAVYSVRCRETVDSMLRSGVRSMREFLARIRVLYANEATCRELDPSGLSWLNVNTPDEWERAQRRLSGAGTGSAG